MSEPKLVEWQELSDNLRWADAEAAAMPGLLKCTVTCLPWRKISKRHQESLDAAHRKNTGGKERLL